MIEFHFSDCLKEQVEQLENEMCNLKDELNTKKEKEELLKECEIEKQTYIERNFELHKIVDGLQKEVERLNELVEKTKSEQEASYEKTKQLNDEVVFLILV